MMYINLVLIIKQEFTHIFKLCKLLVHFAQFREATLQINKQFDRDLRSVVTFRNCYQISFYYTIVYEEYHFG